MGHRNTFSTRGRTHTQTPPVSYTQLAGRLAVQKPTLKGHRGCVNTLAWNSQGSLLVSGSDDCTIKLWNPYSPEPLLESFESGHTSNIFSAKFLFASNDSKIVSCAANGRVRYLEVADSKPVVNGLFMCHSEMTYEVFPDPENPHVFFSCSDDGTVNQYDTRIATSCPCSDNCNKFCLIDINRSVSKHPAARLDPPRGIPKTSRVTSASSATRPTNRRLGRFFSEPTGHGVAAISIHPIHTQYLALGCSDDLVRVYDRRIVKPPGTPDYWTSSSTKAVTDATRGEIYAVVPPNFVTTSSSGTGGDNNSSQHRFDPHKITSCKFDPSGSTMDLLVSYSDEKVYLVRPCNGAEDFKTTAFSTSINTASNHDDIKMSEKEFGSENELESPDFDRMTPPALPQPAEDSGQTDIIHSFQGHRNRQTMIKEAYFYGAKSEVIMSGSDDGTLVVWDKATGKVINRIKSDKRVVNCVCPVNPKKFDSMVAVSGIDHDIKILLPTRVESWLDSKNSASGGVGGAEEEEEDEEEEEEEEDEDVDVDGSVVIPRDLLLMYLARMGVTIEDLMGSGGVDSDGEEEAGPNE
ncbi:WD40-repeat-containing domain protein [Obelidium mucronatum]|nr:WD40-repeat-containing domain protein [Obelidium mucronatum]